MGYVEELCWIGHDGLQHRVETADAFATAHATDGEFHFGRCKPSIHD
jgi:hypothetical protein